MSLGESIRSGAKWLILGKLGNRLLEFAFGVALARLLTPTDFGLVATVAVFTGFVGMFTAGGMGQSLIRAKEADEDDFTAVLTLQLAMGLIVYAGFFLAAPYIAHFFGDPIYTDLVRVAALTFLLRPFFVMRNAWLTRRMDFKSRTMVSVASGLLTGVTATALAWSGFGVWSLVLSGLFTAIVQNVWLARLAPVRARLNPDFSIMRKHSGFGAKIVMNDFVTYLRTESKSLILSKLAGPSFLGLFNKAESLSRLPNQLLMSPTMEPLFRAMSKTQDDLDQTRYMLYRTITLLTVYTTPLYVLLWWIAEPFIALVYGEKWIAAGEPMSILSAAGVFLNLIFPCSVVLAAQNRLGQEIYAQSLNLVIVIAVCIFGLNWGLAGVAWGIVLSQALLAVHLYWLSQRLLGTRIGDLASALMPGLGLSGLLFLALLLIDHLIGGPSHLPHAAYLLIMSGSGGLFYLAAFLLIPIPSLRSEAARWQQKLTYGIALINKAARP